MKIYIKNMVSRSCKTIVKNTIENIGFQFNKIELGEIDIPFPLSPIQLNLFKTQLLNSGFELLEDRKSVLVEKIKNTVVQMIHFNNDIPRMNYSNYISEKLQYDYTYLAKVFSSVRGTTIEHFIIAHRIEKVKELLGYGELSLTEISYKLYYSSSAHLSSQFKKITGITPSEYKKNKNIPRVELEDL